MLDRVEERSSSTDFLFAQQLRKALCDLLHEEVGAELGGLDKDRLTLVVSQGPLFVGDVVERLEVVLRDCVHRGRPAVVVLLSALCEQIRDAFHLRGTDCVH